MKLIVALALFALVIKLVLVLVPIVDVALGCKYMCGI
jgi:hypothetical protein